MLNRADAIPRGHAKRRIDRHVCRNARF
jgi:hypothetical protein